MYKKEIDKKFGDVILSGDFLVEEERHVYSLGPKLDAGLSGGVPEGCFMVFAGNEGCGKAQPLHSIVYTPDGPAEIGSLSVGDTVCTPDGGTSKVIGVFPQGKKDIYRVYTSDNSFTDCCEEHLWTIEDVNNYRERTLSLKEIMDSDIIRTNNGRKYRLPRVESCYFNKRNVSIHPYIMGCILGDGGVSQPSSVNYTTTDRELVYSIQELLPEDHIIKQRCDLEIEYNIVSVGIRENNVLNSLREYGLQGKDSITKFIPHEYIYNTVSVRKDILAGLLDTDGHILNGKNTIEYNTSSSELKDGVKSIVESLGGVVTISERYPKYTYKGEKLTSKNINYRMFIKLDFNPFRLERKQSVYKNRTKYFPRKFISKIEKLAGKQDAVCIKIDSKKQLYLTDSYIPTHNTTLSLYLAKQFIDRDKPVFFLDVEHRLRRKNMKSVDGLDPSKLKYIRSTEEDTLESEDFLEILLALAKDPENKGGLAIVDSVDALIPESVREKGNVSGSRRAPNARTAADAIRLITPYICVNNFTVIFIAHLYDNVSGYGGAVIGGGRYQRYQSGIVLKAPRKPKELIENDKQIGHIVEWDILKSELGPPPGVPVENFIRFGHGVDEITEMLHTASELGLILKSGSWYVLNFLDSDEPVKVQGANKFFARMKEEPEEFKLLQEKYKELLCS